jgi:hypothetical protein
LEEITISILFHWQLHEIDLTLHSLFAVICIFVDYYISFLQELKPWYIKKMCSCNCTFLLDIRARYLVNRVFCVSITTIWAYVKVNMLQDVSTVLLLHPTFSKFCLVEQESPLLHLPMLQWMLSLLVLSEIWASSVFSFALQSALCISCTFCFCHSGSHIDHLKTSHNSTEHAVLNASIFLLLDVEQVQGRVFV